MQRFFATLSSPFSNGSSSKSKSRRKEHGRREEPIIVDNPKAMIVEYGSQIRRAPTAPPYHHTGGAHRHDDTGLQYRSSKSVGHRDHTRAQSHHERRGSTRHRRRKSRSPSYDSSRSRSSRERYDRHDRHQHRDRRDHRRSEMASARYYHSRPPSPTPRHREGLSADLRRAASVPRQTPNRGRQPAPIKPPTIRAASSFYASDSSSDISDRRNSSPVRRAPPLPSGGFAAPPPPPGLGHSGYPPYGRGSHATYMAHAPGYNPYPGSLAPGPLGPPGPPGPPSHAPYGPQMYPKNHFSGYPPVDVQLGYPIPRGRPDERWRGQEYPGHFGSHGGMSSAGSSTIAPVYIGGSTVSGPPDAQYNTLYAGWSPPPTVVYGLR